MILWTARSICVCVCVCVRACVCACVCVSVCGPGRKRPRENETGRQKKGERKRIFSNSKCKIKLMCWQKLFIFMPNVHLWTMDIYFILQIFPNFFAQFNVSTLFAFYVRRPAVPKQDVCPHLSQQHCVCYQSTPFLHKQSGYPTCTVRYTAMCTLPRVHYAYMVRIHHYVCIISVCHCVCIFRVNNCVYVVRVHCKHRTCDWKVASSNPGSSGGRIFFSRVNFVCWLLFNVHSTPVLPQWHAKDPGHSAKSAGGRWHLNVHTPLTHQSQSGLTVALSRQSVGFYQETSSHTACQRTLGHSHLNLLSHCGQILA